MRLRHVNLLFRGEDYSKGWNGAEVTISSVDTCKCSFIYQGKCLQKFRVYIKMLASTRLYQSKCFILNFKILPLTSSLFDPRPRSHYFSMAQKKSFMQIRFEILSSLLFTLTTLSWIKYLFPSKGLFPKVYCPYLDSLSPSSYLSIYLPPF